jgi:hypothetical protein
MYVISDEIETFLMHENFLSNMNMFLQFIVFRIRFYTVPGRVRIRCHQAGVLKVTNPDPD